MANKIQGNTLLYKIALVLKEKRTKNEPMSLAELGTEIWGDDYGENKGDRDKSLERALRAITSDEKLKEIFSVSERNDFQGKRGSWRLYYNHKLDEEDINIVLLALHCFNCVGDIKINSVMEKVRNCGSGAEDAQGRLKDIMCTEDRKLHNSFDESGEVNNYEVQTDIVKNIEFLYELIVGVDEDNQEGDEDKECDGENTKNVTSIKTGRMISFNLYGFNREGMRVNLGKTYQAHPLYISASGGRFWLIAQMKTKTNFTIFPIDLMMNLAIIPDSDILSNETRKSYDSMKETYMREHMNLSYDDPRYAYLKVKKYSDNKMYDTNFAAYNRIYNTFGSDFTFMYDMAKKLGDEWDIIRVKRSPYGLINWVFSNCEHITFVFDEVLMTEEYMGEHLEDMRVIKSFVDERMRNMRNIT